MLVPRRYWAAPDRKAETYEPPGRRRGGKARETEPPQACHWNGAGQARRSDSSTRDELRFHSYEQAL
jgi:hypothetical protein